MRQKPIFDLQKFLFQILVFLFPTQLSYFFWPDFAHVFGIRVDYLSPTVYLTDLTLFLFLALFLLRQRKEVWKVLKRGKPATYFLISLIIVLNLLISASIFPALIKWIKILELFFLGLAIIKIKKFRLNDWVIKPLALSVFFFSGVAITQFLKGETIGPPFYYLGERTFRLSTPGIARTYFLGHE